MSLERGEWIVLVGDRDFLSSSAGWRARTHIFSTGGAFCWSELLLEVALSQPVCYWARTDHLGSRLHIRYNTACVIREHDLLGVDFGRQIGLCHIW